MRENTECEDRNLVILECLKWIENCLKDERVDIEPKEVAEELNKLTQDYRLSSQSGFLR